MRTIALYVVITVAALVTLLGILRLGEHLTPPMGISGVWHLEWEHADKADTTCQALLPLDASDLQISQSGVHLVLTWVGKQPRLFTGRLQDANISSRSQSVTLAPGVNVVVHSPGCPGKHEAIAKISVEAAPTQRYLTGLLSIPDCPACPAQSFRATRTATKP